MALSKTGYPVPTTWVWVPGAEAASDQPSLGRALGARDTARAMSQEERQMVAGMSRRGTAAHGAR